MATATKAHKSYRDWESYTWSMAGEIANQVYREYCENPLQRLYLWHRPSTPALAGEVCAMADAPQCGGYELSRAEHLPRNITHTALLTWIGETMRRLPILPIESE